MARFERPVSAQLRAHDGTRSRLTGLCGVDSRVLDGYFFEGVGAMDGPTPATSEKRLRSLSSAMPTLD